MSLQAARRPRGNRKTVIIGFDFGTHSTKVVYRERGKVDGYIARFDDVADGYPLFASPSLTRCASNRLYFGTKALTRVRGDLFGSLKVSLLPETQLSGIAFPDGLNNRILVTAYIAWAFQQLRRSMPDCSESNVFVNVAAPMSHVENPELKNRYLQIVQAAWNVSFSERSTPFRQGMLSSEAARVLAPMLDEPILGPEVRRFDVLPETIAPVVSLSLDPWMERGMYMIVDTGAGTTEMSIFHAGESGADQKVLCYRDKTMLIGGNDLQLAERLTDPGRQCAFDIITDRLQKQYRQLWLRGYQLDAPNHHSRQRWKELTLVLSGGGTRHDEVAKSLSGVNPIFPWPDDDTHRKVCRHVPGTLELDPEMDDEDGSMFAVANGLAIERKHWPVVFQPHQIDLLAATEEVELKPQGYWYLDA